ncbi:MAG: DUF4198 domain-containing protein [Desulfuromonas sp.]|nr:DUF4198 domain-containing protein [Desulfuromonas sp.]
MRLIAILLLLALSCPVAALAQLALLTPSDDIISQEAPVVITLHLGLFDPRGRQALEVAKAKRFGVQHLGEETNLLGALKPVQEKNATTWLAEFPVKSPGDYTFYAEQTPRWDTAEEEFLIPLAKVCVNALALEEGWDEPVGLEAEIVPLSRPYGLWSGNLFSGQVLLNGDPAPYAAIEVAWFGPSPETSATLSAAPPACRVQKLRADANGIFHYAMPRGGWWGFAASLDADWTIKKDGEEKPVTLVTSYWVQAREIK